MCHPRLLSRAQAPATRAQMICKLREGQYMVPANPSMRVYSKQGTRSGRRRGQRQGRTTFRKRKRLVAISTGNKLSPPPPREDETRVRHYLFCVCSEHEPRTRELESKGPHLRGESRSSDPRDKFRKNCRFGLKPTIEQCFPMFFSRAPENAFFPVSVLFSRRLARPKNDQRSEQTHRARKRMN